MVRVLIVAPSPIGEGRIGGIANFIRNFIEFMPEDFEVEVVGVAVGDETPGTRWHDVSLRGRQIRFLPVARIPTARRSGPIPTKAQIVAGMIANQRRIAMKGRVAEVHAPGMDLGLHRSTPIVRIVHNYHADLAASGSGGWRRLGWGLRLAERVTLARAAHVFFVNRSSFERYAQDFPYAARRMHFISNGVDPTIFRPLSEAQRLAARARLSDELDLDPDERWLLFAGRLDQQKDPELLLRSFAMYHARGYKPGTRLLIVGDGQLREKSERLATDLGIDSSVDFLGLWTRDRLALLMGAADGFALASEFEASPFVVFEALAAGLPVASTAVGEVPSIVSHGETGWIATERSTEAVADAIEWVLAQPRATIAPLASASVIPYHLATVLAPLYDDHRLLARR